MRLLLGALSLWIGVCHVQAAAVFAHFMVTNTDNFTAYDWELNMVLAQNAHIDAFVLNMAYDDPTNYPSLEVGFEAANKIGFHLLFSFDFAGNGPWPQSDIIDLINKYGSNGAYFLHEGQPFVSTFEGPANASDWKEIKEQTGCFFVPDWSSLGAKAALEVAPGVPDGLFSWAAWPWGSNAMDTYVDASYMEYLDGLPYMMPVSPWFYTNLPGYKKNWLWNGDDLWYDRWQEVMYLQPEFVQIISWNDYGESHYIGPLYDNAYAAFDIGNASYNYVADYPHDAWRAFLPFVIDLYKTGTATIKTEGVTSWFRQTPGAACPNGGTSANTASQFQVEFTPTEVLQDRVFYSALLASPADVTVSIGGAVQKGTWRNKPDGGIGIYHGSVPFTGYTGQVIVTISRNGAEVAEMQGASISNSCAEGTQNWNAWAGSSFGSSAVSATPDLKISEQVCIEGTGPNKFERLCGFSCKYGYCPVGACVCTAMGDANVLPNATGIDGYPLPGEGPSYSGLCSFNCNYGDCDPEACGTTEVELVIPTVSDFAPPACVSGTGEGNLAGLCSFSCGFGFCPINACTCTATGPLVLPPPPKDIAGYAASGFDSAIYGPICEFTCNHGYCPPGACATNSYGSDDSATPGTVGIKPLPCTSLGPSETFTMSAACTDGILSLPTSGSGASSNNIPAGSPEVCHEVCDFFRMLSGTCCGQGGKLANQIDVVPGVVIPFDIPLPAGFRPNINLEIPVPGQYDPDEIFGNKDDTPITTSPTSSTTTDIITYTYTTTYTSLSTFPVTTTNSDGQQTAVQITSPVVTTSVGTTTSDKPPETDKPTSEGPRKTCRTIADGTPVQTFLAHIPLASMISLPAGMCLPGTDPLHIPPIPLPDIDPPCYVDCQPCHSGACGGSKTNNPASGSNYFDPNNPNPPEDACTNGEGPSPEQGTCGNGNFPLWDSSTGQVSCDMPASEAQNYLSDCQADAVDSLDDTLEAIECVDSGCSTGLAKRGKRCPKQPGAYQPSQNPGSCDAVFVCDVDKWPNVCNNARSAMDKKNAPAILTYRGNGMHNTGAWLTTHGMGQNEGGNERKGKSKARDEGKLKPRSGWGLIGCEVEEYPWGNSVTSSAGHANYNDRPTLRLIPDDENGNHGSELKKFLEYLRYSTKKTNPTYCVEVKSGTGQSLPSDYCLSEYTQCNNKCASAYGPSFVLVSSISDGDRKAAKAAGLKSTQEWDLWFDDPAHPKRKWDHTLSYDPALLAANPPQSAPVISLMPPQFPPSFNVHKQDPPGPGQKIYVGNFPIGSWELSYSTLGQVITVGTSLAAAAKPDGSHLIWEQPPGNQFPYMKRNASPETKSESTADHADLLSEDLEFHQSNISVRADLSNPLPVAGRLSRRATLPDTSFLDPRVYTNVLSCALDSELSGCDDCDIQAGPATPTVGAGTVTTTTAPEPTGPSPVSGGTEGCVAIAYYQDDREDLHEYLGFEFYPRMPSMPVCPELTSPDWTKLGAWDSMPSEMTEISAFGDTCTYNSNGKTPQLGYSTQVGTLKCKKWRDAPCFYEGSSGTCKNPWQTYRYLVNCDWGDHYGN